MIHASTGIRARRAARLTIVVVLLVVPARAWAFDCAMAHGEAEVALCADPATRRADDDMNAAFQQLKDRLSPAQARALVINQKRWLVSRMDPEAAGTALGNDCSDDKRQLSACLRRMEEARTRTLEGRAAAGPGAPDRLVPVFVERPLTKTSYAVGLLLYRFPDPRTAGERALAAARLFAISAATFAALQLNGVCGTWRA